MPNSFDDSVNKAIANIAKIKAGIDTLATSVKNINTEAIKQLKFVGQDTQNLTNLDKKYKSLESTILKLKSTIDALKQKQNEETDATKNLEQALRKKEAALKKVDRATSESVVKSAQLRKAADLEAKANSNLAGTYLNLIAKRDVAKQKLQNLLTAENQNTAAIKVASAELRKHEARLNAVNKAVSVASGKRGFLGLTKIITNLAAGFGIVAGVQLFADIIKSSFNLAKELDALNFSLNAVTGSAVETLRVTKFLSQTARENGADIIALTKSYVNFRAAAQQTNLTIEETERIFQVFTKVGGALGKRADELKGIFLALEQMLSKGKVTTEELRRQLGERLPGAFAIMARAVGVSTDELDKMLRKGEIIAADILPKMADETAKAFGLLRIDEVKTLNAESTRLGNTWKELVKNLSEGGLSDVLSFVLKILNEILVALGKIVQIFPDIATVLNDPVLSLNAKNNIGILLINNLTGFFKKEATEIREFAANAKAELKDFAQFVSDFGTETGFRPDSKEGISLIRALGIDVNTKNGKQEIIEKLKILFGAVTGELKKDGVLDISDIMDLTNPQKIQRLKNELERLRLKAFTFGVINKGNVDIFKEIVAKRIAVQKEIDKLTNGVEDPGDGKRNEALKGTRRFLDEIVSKLIDERESTARTAEEWKKKTEAIERAKKAAAAFEKIIASTRVKEENLPETKPPGAKGNKVPEVKTSPEFKTPSADEVNAGLLKNKLDKEAKAADAAAEALKKLREELKKYLEEVAFDALDETGFGSLAQFLDGTFKDLMKGAVTDIEKIAVVTKAVGDVTLDFLDIIDQAQEAKFQNQLDRLQIEKDTAIKFAGDSTAAKKKIDEDFDRRRRVLENKRAKQVKKKAIFESIINTAVGVTAAAPNVALMTAIGVLGAAETAFIAAQKIPQFEKGTKNANEGLAIVDEKRPEVHTDKHGRVKSMGGKSANLRYLSKGDKIYPSREKWIEDVANSAGKIGENYTIARVESKGATASDMDAIMEKYFSKIQVVEERIDKSGFKKYIVGQNARTEERNRRATFRGFVR